MASVLAEDFDAAWLRRRRIADHQARDHGLDARLASWTAERGELRVLDLGAGSGSNAAFLAPRLPQPQHWVLVDHDRGLLASALAALEGMPDVTGEAVMADLVEPAAIPVEGADLVTASALLDLVTAEWLAAVIERAGHARSALLFALSYSGGIAWDPPLADDALALAAFNDHQRGDKGFGPALGPDGDDTAAAMSQRFGYRVCQRASPWRLGPEDGRLQAALLDGCWSAAVAQAPAQADALSEWWTARRAAIDAGRSRVRVAHRDLLGLPP